MRGPGREERAAALLFRTARARVGELQSRLADIEAAIVSTETSLDWLAEAVRAAEDARRGDAAVAAEFARFLEGAAEKRKALNATRDTLAGESLALRETLGEALSEMKKLEHLIEINRRAAARGERAFRAGGRRPLVVDGGRTGAA